MPPAVSAVGWIVNYVLLQDRRENEVAWLQDCPISETIGVALGPLTFLMLEGRRSFKDLLDKLGRNHVFVHNCDLPKDELDLWLFWVDHDLMPRNITVKNLLSAHTHLVVGDQLPNSYIRVS